jgi:carbon-monoxide dehydrogenase large subunit
MIDARFARPPLADSRVRFVGELVAAVVSETPEQGADAAELIWPDYEPMPALIDIAEAMTDEHLLFPEVGTNVALALSFGTTDEFFDGCEVVVTEQLLNQRVAGCPLEVRSSAAAWGEDGRLHQWVSTQAPQQARDDIAAFLGIEVEQMHVIAPDVGGGFGPKIGTYPEEQLLGWLARRVGRPVRWIETRSENMVGMGHGRGQHQTIEIGGRRDGTVTHYRLHVLQEAGAYPMLGTSLPFLTRAMASGVYEIDHVEFDAKSLVTNTTPTVAYRGAGRPEATAAIERAMDLFAAEIGLDPADVRRKNLIPADAFPYTTPVGTVYDIGDYETSLDLVLEAADYAALRHEQARRREDGSSLLLGIGVSVYVEVTAGPSAGGEYGRVEINTDGSATVFTGSSSHGQGHDTAFAMIASDELGIPIEAIEVRHGDTDEVTKGVGTFGSRSLQLGGSAILQASEETVERAREIAADLFEAAEADIVLDKVSGSFQVAGTPALTKSWAEIVAAAGQDGLRVEADFQAPSPTFPFGAHLAVVEVDADTGAVRLDRIVTADDAGRILNPMLVEGQRHGGIAQGAAQALLEEFRYDEDGNPVTSNFADYGIISATELPSFELLTQETPTPVNRLGAKGIGESGTIGSTPAIQSAVVDALSHLGVRHLDMPASPERVWRAIASA